MQISSNNFPKTYKAIEKYFNIDPISNDFNLCSKCKSIINANDKNNKSKICSSCSNNELIQFTVYNANGGRVVETRRYDRQKDRSSNGLYVITSNQDFGHEIDKIITMELLR